MNLADVAQELADQLATIVPRSTPYAPDAISPPAAYVFGPETTYDESYGRGLDTARLSVTVAVARVPLAVAWKSLAGYVSGSGPSSVKVLLEAGTYTSFDTIQVIGSHVGDVNLGGDDYKAVAFDLVITGSGEQ